MSNVDRCIISSLLDNDLYKFTMQNAVFTLFPDAVVEYRFINRGDNPWGARFVESLKDQIEAYCDLKFAPSEVNFLRRECPYLSPHYLEWLEGYRPDPSEVYVEGSGSNFLGLKIRGPWYRTILWEVPLMALISELRYICDPLMAGVILDRSKDIDKAKLMSLLVPYSEFGTRRRYSRENQEQIIGIHKKHGGRMFSGTSNVWMAKEYGLKPIGTMAHEWIMFHGSAYGIERANEMALRNWHSVYQGALGIALTDTYTSDLFFDGVSAEMAMIYDGLRHDSGDPIAFAYNAADFYRKHGIDSSTKRILFSDGLTVSRAAEITEACRTLDAQIGFGIGTHFTNDVGLPPMNMVIKLWAASLRGPRLLPTVKLSDVPGKHTGEKQEVDHAEWLIGQLLGREV